MTKMMWIPIVMATAMYAHAEPAKPTPIGDVKWTPLVPQLGAKSPQMSVVFGDVKNGPVGLLLKFPPGFTPGPHTHSSDYYGVSIAGVVQDADVGKLEASPKLGPGGHWMEAANHPHDNQCSPAGECIEFVYFPRGFDMKPFKP